MNIDFSKDAKEIARDFSRLTNNFSFDYKGLAEELRDSKDMRKLAFYWLRVVSSTNYRADGRNEIAARKGRKLAEVSFIKKKIENLKEDVKMVEICNEISYDHKTLQQTFSKFVFYYIFLTATEKQQKQLIDRIGERFYLLPLI